MERKRIYLSSPTMHGEEQAFVQSAFDTNWVAPLGPNVDAFEKEMADYIGGGYAAALSAGTAAIHLAVILAGVKEGDVVFAQSLTFAASVNPACYEKAKPVFIDSEPDTWNMDPVALEKAFEKYPHPAAVIACASVRNTFQNRPHPRHLQKASGSADRGCCGSAGELLPGSEAWYLWGLWHSFF